MFLIFNEISNTSDSRIFIIIVQIFFEKIKMCMYRFLNRLKRSILHTGKMEENFNFNLFIEFIDF